MHDPSLSFIVATCLSDYEKSLQRDEISTPAPRRTPCTLPLRSLQAREGLGGPDQELIDFF
jgi:hypothetical protein